MKRETIRSAVEAVIAEYDVSAHCRWSNRPPMLVVSYRGTDWQISARAGMSAKALGFELGKLDTLARLIAAGAQSQSQPKRSVDPRQMGLEEAIGAVV